MKTALQIALVAATAVTAACTGPVGGTTASPTYNRHQCRDLDWRMAGLADGIKGYENVEERFNSLDKNCVQHGVHADRALYDAGYAEGRRRAGG